MADLKINILEMLWWLVRYRTKEIMGFIIIVLSLILISLMISWDKYNGLKITPSVKIEVNK